MLDSTLGSPAFLRFGSPATTRSRPRVGLVVFVRKQRSRRLVALPACVGAPGVGSVMGLRRHSRCGMRWVAPARRDGRYLCCALLCQNRVAVCFLCALLCTGYRRKTASSVSPCSADTASARCPEKPACQASLRTRRQTRHETYRHTHTRTPGERESMREL